MTYRYPFTPFPKSWYRIEARRKRVIAFGKELKLEHIGQGEHRLCEISNPKKSFPIVKKNGNLFAFFDQEAGEPYFDIPDIPEFNDQGWQRPFYLSWEKTRVHVQEVAENALDLSHFCTVHTYKDIPTLSRFHIYEHRFNVVMHSRKKVLGFTAHTNMDITYHGMGIVVANVDSSSGVTLKVLLMSTPIDQEKVDIYMGVAIKKTTNPIKNFLFKWLLPFEIKAEFTRDIPVWEAKIYRSKPMVCNNEGNIIRIRKWAKQFY